MLTIEINMVRELRQQNIFRKCFTIGGGLNFTQNVGENYHIKKVSFVGETPLHVACRNGNLVQVTKILSSPKVNINARDYNNWTPLHEAISHGQLPCINKLLNYKTSSIESYFVPPRKRK